MKCPSCTICAGTCLGETVPRLCALAEVHADYRAELESRAEDTGGVVRAASLEEAIASWWGASVALHQADTARKEGRPVPATGKKCCGEKEQAAKPRASAGPAPQGEREQLPAPEARPPDEPLVVASARPRRERPRDPAARQVPRDRRRRR